MFTYDSLLGAVTPVFIMIAIGWVMRRTGALSSAADASILRLGVNVFYPSLIADTIIGNPALQQLSNVLLPAACGAGTALVGFSVALLSARLLGMGRPHPTRTFAFTVGLQNYGYLAIPLVQALFNRETLGVQFTFTLGIELVLWSAGIWLLSGHQHPSIPPNEETSGTDDDPEERPRPVRHSLWRAVLTAPVVAIIVSSTLNYFFGGGWLPGFARTSLHWLGACAFPTQITLTGAVLADVMRRANPGPWLKPVTFGNLIRLGLLPAIFLLAAKGLHTSPELRNILVVQAAMPSAMLPIILVKHYGGETDLAAWLVTTTTAVGFLTMPLWLKAGLWWLGN